MYFFYLSFLFILIPSDVQVSLFNIFRFSVLCVLYIQILQTTSSTYLLCEFLLLKSSPLSPFQLHLHLFWYIFGNVPMANNFLLVFSTYMFWLTFSTSVMILIIMEFLMKDRFCIKEEFKTQMSDVLDIGEI